MSEAATVGGDAFLRLFLALRLAGGDRDRLGRWAADLLAGVAGRDGLRAIAPDDLHVTLAFLGRRPATEVEPVVAALRECAAAAGPIALTPVRWRLTRSVGMLVLDDAGGAATAMAAALHGRLEELGVYRPERRPWLPHVTLCRFRHPPALSAPALPGGTCVPSDAAAYVSHLHPSGARYEALAAVRLTATHPIEQHP